MADVITGEVAEGSLFDGVLPVFMITGVANIGEVKLWMIAIHEHELGLYS